MEDRSSDHRNGCCFHFSRCCKCLRTVSKVPCCLTRLLVGFICIGMTLSIGLGLYYGLDFLEMYDKAKDFVSPYVGDHLPPIPGHHHNNPTTTSPEYTSPPPTATTG